MLSFQHGWIQDSDVTVEKQVVTRYISFCISMACYKAWQSIISRLDQSQVNRNVATLTHAQYINTEKTHCRALFL